MKSNFEKARKETRLIKIVDHLERVDVKSITSVIITYTEACRTDAEAHSHHKYLLGFGQGHEPPIVLIKGRNDRLKILNVALSPRWEPWQDFFPEPN